MNESREGHLPDPARLCHAFGIGAIRAHDVVTPVADRKTPHALAARLGVGCVAGTGGNPLQRVHAQSRQGVAIEPVRQPALLQGQHFASLHDDVGIRIVHIAVPFEPAP